MKFNFGWVLLLTISSQAAPNDLPMPDLKVNVLIDGKAVEFLGLLGADEKNIVPVYSANCAGNKNCAAVTQAMSAKTSLVTKADREGGKEPSYILCEKLQGELVSGTSQGLKKKSLYCYFRNKQHPKQSSYIDPGVLWQVALESKSKS